MAKGILGRKVGMTQVFDNEGRLIPVTVVQVTPNVVLQKKTVATDGYESVQLGFLDKRANLVNKPATARFEKAGTTPKRYIKEIRLSAMLEYEVGQEVKCDIFAPGDYVDVTGTSKGKGYQGNIKRHGYRTGPNSHGSKYHRGIGAMSTMAPNHVHKGKKMPGRMGNDTITIQGLAVVSADVANNILLIKGCVPGSKKSLLVIKNAVKSHK